MHVYASPCRVASPSNYRRAITVTITARFRSLSFVVRIDAPRRFRITCGVPAKPSALVDTRVIYCGDNLEQLRKLPEGCVATPSKLNHISQFYGDGSKFRLIE